MADKSLYDILEVSPNASQEAIRAAYERLSAKYDPYTQSGTFNADIKIQHDAVKEAFFTLGAPGKRAKYDQGLLSKLTIPPPAQPPSSTWSTATFAIVILALCGSVWIYYQHKQTEIAITAERAAAEAKAQEAAETARTLAEQARAETDGSRGTIQQHRAILSVEERARREHEMSLRNYSIEQRSSSQTAEMQARREMQEQRRTEESRRREEQQAETAARAQAAREKAELCRIERERYGRAISC